MRTSAIQSILIIAGAALGAALLGLLGAYFVLPNVAPGVTADAGAEKQASATPDTTVNRTPPSDTTQSPATAARTATDDDASADQDASPSETQEEMRDRTKADRMEAAMSSEPAVSTGTTPSAEPAPSEETTPSAETASPEESTPSDETASQEPSEPAVAQALRDSLQTLHRRLQQTKEEASALRTEVDTLREKLAAAATERAKVNELSDALMDMRRRPLTNLLKEVNMSVLKKLYQETGGKSRTRLLQSLAPARAAKFINEVVEGGASVSSGSPAVPDSTVASR